MNQVKNILEWILAYCEKARSFVHNISRDAFMTNEEKQYSDFIEMFIIESGSTIPEMYPDTSHQEIVQRALYRKKPFKSNGKDGYRDFLVWKTFLDISRVE